MSLTELMGNVGLFGLAVMVCLAVLSVFSVGMILQKHRRFRKASRQTQSFKSMFGKSLRAGEFQQVVEAAKVNKDSHVAQVVSAGLLEYDVTCRNSNDPA